MAGWTDCHHKHSKTPDCVCDWLSADFFFKQISKYYHGMLSFPLKCQKCASERFSCVPEWGNGRLGMPLGLPPVWCVESLTRLGGWAGCLLFPHWKIWKIQGSRWMCGQSELSVSFLVTRINLNHLVKQTRNFFYPLCPQSREWLQLAGGLFLGLEYSEGKERSCSLFQHSYFKRSPI